MISQFPSAGATRSSPLRVVVLGYLVRGPIGGMAWHHLQYVVGLSRLGHEVLFLEESDDYPSCYDPTTSVVGTDPRYGLVFAKQAFDRLSMPECWAYYDAHLDAWHGPAAGRALEFCSTADLLINISGVNPLRPWFDPIDVRVLIDTDPVFTQLRHLTDELAHQRAVSHNVFLTFGESIGQPGCEIPNDGFPWQPTRQPVVLDCWPVTPAPPGGKYTTVMQWDSYPAKVHEGRTFGMKSDSFAPFEDLPQRLGQRFELALGSATAPRERLRAKGWGLVDPLAVTRDPWTYQAYLQASRGEFSVAKQGYVTTRSGWFSERSAAYLASGRPVVVQETGFSGHLPHGAGLHAFDGLDSAMAAIERVESNYPAECNAARELAGDAFDARGVLTDLIDRAQSLSHLSVPAHGQPKE